MTICTAWRFWYYDRQGNRLVSGLPVPEWKPGQWTQAPPCHIPDYHPDEPTPGFKCRCGLYAVQDIGHLVGYLASKRGRTMSTWLRRFTALERDPGLLLKLRVNAYGVTEQEGRQLRVMSTTTPGPPHLPDLIGRVEVQGPVHPPQHCAFAGHLWAGGHKEADAINPLTTIRAAALRPVGPLYLRPGLASFADRIDHPVRVVGKTDGKWLTAVRNDAQGEQL
ncbi:hypothetical protein ACWC3X_07320 [Streptomyces populi]